MMGHLQRNGDLVSFNGIVVEPRHLIFGCSWRTGSL